MQSEDANAHGTAMSPGPTLGAHSASVTAPANDSPQSPAAANTATSSVPSADDAPLTFKGVAIAFERFVPRKGDNGC